ncbi:MAG: heat-inducible transcription repressor HrcA [Chloroflexi bacterium]|jgi:heat-inducible transcriptional repressor|nr:heat-inducible transcription repressor HrcA [Chloroflexota bacterium]
MEKLTNRQQRILSLIIHEHIRSAEPVGSNRLVSDYNLDLSSATVRNEMAFLTDTGFLRQPHTSAGRVPTEEGYRYFVGNLMRNTTLPEDARRTISHQFYQSRNDISNWMHLAASILANQSKSASLVTSPHPEQVRFKHLELIATHSTQILAVLVLEGGEIHQSVMSTDVPVTQEELSTISNRMSALFQAKNHTEIKLLTNQYSDLEKNILEWLTTEMKQTEELTAGEVILDGLTNVLSEPEFMESDEARRALKLIEERTLLQELITRSMMKDQTNGVQVLIGGEGTWDEFKQMSIILAKYGLPGVATGTLGVFGPIRMSYGHSISIVRFLSSLMSDFIAEQW